MSNEIDNYRNYEQPMRTWSHAQLIFHIDKLEMDYATGQNIIEEVQQQLKQVTQERDEGRDVIAFYGDKDNWSQVDSWQFEIIHKSDMRTVKDVYQCVFGGKRADEHQKKWDKITQNSAGD